MRRALLTVGGAAPFTVGETNLTADDTNGTGYLVVSPSNPAPRAGTLTSLNVTMNTGGTVRVVTGSLNTGTGAFTVAQVSSAITVATGSNTGVTISVPIASGHYLGLWTPTSGGGKLGQRDAGTGWYAIQDDATPSGTISLNGPDIGLCANATGA